MLLTYRHLFSVSFCVCWPRKFWMEFPPALADYEMLMFTFTPINKSALCCKCASAMSSSVLKLCKLLTD